MSAEEIPLGGEAIRIGEPTSEEKTSQELQQSTVALESTIQRCLDFSIAWSCFIIVASYIGCAIQGVLVWPMWFPSETFNDRIGHLISSTGIPLSIVPMSVFVFCRHHIVKLGDRHQEVQRLNDASLTAISIGIVSMVGVVTVNFSLSPAIHYLFAGVFFLAFAIDTVLQMMIARFMNVDTYQQLRGGTSKNKRYAVGGGVLVAAIASLGGTAVQSYAAMSIAECTFILLIFIFWSQDYDLLARCDISVHLAQRRKLALGESKPCGMCALTRLSPILHYDTNETNLERGI